MTKPERALLLAIARFVVMLPTPRAPIGQFLVRRDAVTDAIEAFENSIGEFKRRVEEGEN